MYIQMSADMCFYAVPEVGVAGLVAGCESLLMDALAGLVAMARLEISAASGSAVSPGPLGLLR